MPINTPPAGYGYSGWAPDEEILADSLNKRERKYGGIPYLDVIGVTDNTPILTLTPAGSELYGEFLYGEGVYSEP